MSKDRNPRRVADNEAMAVSRMLKTSPQKLNLVAAAHPQQAGRQGAGRPHLLQEAGQRGGQEDAAVGDRQRREQPRARRRRADRRRGLGRQEHGLEARAAAGARAVRQDPKAVQPGDDQGAAGCGRGDRLMGQKINPVGLRAAGQPHLGQPLVRRRRRVRQALARGLAIRAFIRKNAAQAGVSRVVIERPHRKCRVTIHAARPGRHHRQEGRRHRGAAQEAGGSSPSRSCTSTSSRCASPRSTRRSSPRTSRSSSSGASASAGR